MLVQLVHSAGVATGSDAGFSGGEIGMMLVSPVLVGAYLVWYAKRMSDRGIVA